MRATRSGTLFTTDEATSSAEEGARLVEAVVGIFTFSELPQQGLLGGDGNQQIAEIRHQQAVEGEYGRSAALQVEKRDEFVGIDDDQVHFVAAHPQV